jgi:hypothetical protein
MASSEKEKTGTWRYFFALGGLRRIRSIFWETPPASQTSPHWIRCPDSVKALVSLHLRP